MDVHTQEINYFGQKIALKSKGEPELIQEVIALAELRVKDAKARGGTHSPQHVTLLALLEMAEEYVRAKRRFVEHKKAVVSKSEEVFQLLETQLGEQQ